MGYRLEGVVFVVDENTGECVGHLVNPAIKFNFKNLEPYKEVALTFDSYESYGDNGTVRALASTERIEGNSSMEEDFESWLAHHQEVTGMKPPRVRTKIRKHIAGMYAARRSEGFTDEELRLAVVGAFNDPYRREHGYFDHESVLRPTKLHKLSEMGRRGVQGKPGTLAQREAAMRSLATGRDERANHAVVLNLCRTVIFPPEPGEIDPFTKQPVMQADEARRKLAELVDDAEATVQRLRPEVLSTTLSLRRSA